MKKKNQFQRPDLSLTEGRYVAIMALIITSKRGWVR